MSTFAVVPAIDLRDDRVVRLRQGDFTREQVYADDPTGVARGFAAAGASWIHLVDLDGARAGERRQASTIAAIVEAVAALPGDRPRLQVAGGLRTLDAIAGVLDGGADRIVIGTAAIQDPALVRQAIRQHGPDRIAVALDIRAGMAIGDGWVPGAAGIPFATAIAGLADAGVATFIVTAIARDGLLGGPDLALLETCARSTDAVVLASGGIRSIADLQAVRAVGCGGAIVGRAIYEGSLDLRAAISALAAAPNPDPATG
jgi:phosphoribosylformimino-5-aminoimidazole carboxamide ribotide isomerase